MPLLLSLVLVLGFWLGGVLRFSDTPLSSMSSEKQKLSRLIDFIDYEYVDAVNTDSIVEVTVNKILENLDPHSVYIPPEDVAAVTENMNGSFVGIGVSFYVRKDTISVIRAMENGPSALAGIKGGDKILMANTDTLYGKQITNTDVVKILKGALDTEVTLQVYRASVDSLFQVSIQRKKVPIKSVPVAYMVKGNIGYVKINRFAETTYKEFKKALELLQDKGMKELILDVRGNPGGFLDRANQIVDEFLSGGTLIMFTKDKRGVEERFLATNKGSFENGMVYVLIDEESASASEIVAGALQDNDKGVIVGRRSFGKGLVQREMQLGDGSAVRLTVSRYYTPTGRSIQKSYKNKNDQDYYDDYITRHLSGELKDSTKIKVIDSLKFTTPKGKIVYGGGGITPDVFVPIESDELLGRVKFVLGSNLLDNFVFDVLERDRSYYHSLAATEFLSSYQVPFQLVQEFKDFMMVRTRGELRISYSDHDAVIERSIKAKMAEQLFDENLAHQILLEDDAMLQKVFSLASKID